MEASGKRTRRESLRLREKREAESTDTTVTAVSVEEDGASSDDEGKPRKRKALSAAAKKAEAAPGDLAAEEEEFKMLIEEAAAWNDKYRAEVAQAARREAEKKRSEMMLNMELQASEKGELPKGEDAAAPDDEEGEEDLDDDDNETPAADDPAVPIVRKAFPSDPELRADLIATNLFELRELTPSKVSRKELRLKWIRLCCPDLEVIMAGCGVPTEVAEVLLRLSEWGTRRVGVKIMKASLQSAVDGLRERMKGLHTAYANAYLSKATYLIVALQQFESARQQRGTEVWFELVPLFAFMWSGVMDDEVPFAFKGEGAGAARWKIDVEWLPGTFTVSWIQIVGPMGGRVCWVIILWAMAVGVHVPHPGEDGSDMWVTKTLRLRHKEAVRGKSSMASVAREQLGPAADLMTEDEQVSAGASIMGAASAPPATRGGMYGVSRDESGKQRTFEATLKKCGVCTVVARLKWNNGQNLSSMNGGKHSAQCPVCPGKEHQANSTPAVTAPIWLLNDQRERQGDQLTEEDYERLYHPKGSQVL